MSIEALKNIVDEHLSDAVIGIDESASPKALIIKDAHIFDVCRLLFNDSRTYFDMLSCITGIDNGPETNTIEVAYNLYSIPYDLHLMLKVELSREKPIIQSVAKIWKTALWHERETYDLFGIEFTGHPDLRRILLPADWQGHPLRKDYQHQEYYRGIKVEY